MSAHPHPELVAEFTYVLTKLCAVLRPRWLPTITHKQINLLNQLDRWNPTNPHALAEACGIGRPAISEAIRRLVKLKLVDMQRDPADRRFVQIRLTAEGERMRRLPSAVDVAHVREFLRWVMQFNGGGVRRLLDRLRSILTAAETSLKGRAETTAADVAFEAAPPRRAEEERKARNREEEAVTIAREELARDPEVARMLGELMVDGGPPELAPDGSVELEADNYDEGAFERSRHADEEEPSTERPQAKPAVIEDEEPVVVVLDDTEDPHDADDELEREREVHGHHEGKERGANEAPERDGSR